MRIKNSAALTLNYSTNDLQRLSFQFTSSPLYSQRHVAEDTQQKPPIQMILQVRQLNIEFTANTGIQAFEKIFLQKTEF